MELKGGQQIAASVEQVWAGLFDPEVLQQCLPGCESVTRESEYAYTSKLALKIGPVSARFSGRVEMQDVQAPQSCKLVFQGTGGTAGFARGEAQVQLTPRDGGTYLEYDASINVGGKLAQIGARLIDTTAKKLAGQFFERFRAVFDPEGAQEEALGRRAAEPAVQAQAAAEAGSGPAALDASTSSASPASRATAAGAADTASHASGTGAPSAVPMASRAAAPSKTPSLLAQFWQARAVWFVLGAGLSAAMTHEWLDERAGWFILGAALSYLIVRMGGGKA